MICRSVFGSQNLPLPHGMYPPFQQINMCDPPRIYPSLPEYNPLFNKCICATIPETTPPSQNILPFSTNVYVRPSEKLPLPLRFFNNFICATPPESTPPSQNISPLSKHLYVRSSQNIPLISHFICQLKTGYIPGGRGRFWEGRT